MELPAFLCQSMPDTIHLSGSRIGLEHVIVPFNEGHSAEMIFDELDGPPLAVIFKAIAFYLENRVEVDRYLEKVAAIEAQLEAEHPPSAALLEIRQQTELRRKVRLGTS